MCPALWTRRVPVPATLLAKPQPDSADTLTNNAMRRAVRFMWRESTPPPNRVKSGKSSC